MLLRKNGIHDARILTAMEKIPRDAFVGQSYKHLAYQDQSLPLMAGQTISQPLVVAKMTQALELTANSRVLEIGTGSGYQAAVLSQVCRRVASIERIRTLYQEAGQRLTDLGIYNVDLRLGDGSQGWPEAAPFDAIIVTCAPETLSESLFDQLVIGGRLIAPLGDQSDQQTLRIYQKVSHTQLRASTLGLVNFVPMLRGTA